MAIIPNFLKTTLILLTGGICLLSCTDQQKSGSKESNHSDSTEATIVRDTQIEKVLARQLKNGASMEFAAAEYGKPDFLEAAHVADVILRKNGYIEREDFIDKLKATFGNQNFKADGVNALSYETGCLHNDKTYSLDESGNSPYLFVDLKNKMIMDFYPLPLLIDYEKNYPELSEIEAKPIMVHDAVEGSDVEVTRWKNFPKLSLERKQNIHRIISRNKYLFNNSKADFLWLQNNDQAFLGKLVTAFGYLKDTELNRWVLDGQLILPNKQNEDAFGQVLWRKNCDAKINVHKEIFDLIKTETNDSNIKYLTSLADYIIYLRDRDQILPYAQRAEILAKVAYYSQMIVNNNEKKFEQDYYTRFMFPLIQILQTKKLLEAEFKKHNYYSLPGFKELWQEQIDYNGGVGMVM